MMPILLLLLGAAALMFAGKSEAKTTNLPPGTPGAPPPPPGGYPGGYPGSPGSPGTPGVPVSGTQQMSEGDKIAAAFMQNQAGYWSSAEGQAAMAGRDAAKQFMSAQAAYWESPQGQAEIAARAAAVGAPPSSPTDLKEFLKKAATSDTAKNAAKSLAAKLGIGIPDL